MKKYMFVVPCLSKGGAERVVSVLASGLAERGYDVTVLRYFKTDADYPISEKVNIITLSDGYEKNYNNIGKLKRFRLMHKAFKNENPDYIIPFLGYVNLQTVIASGRFFKRLVYTVRISPYGLNSLRVKIRAFLINHTNCTIVQNAEQREYFNKSAEKRISILSNPVNESFLNAKRKNPDENYTVVAAGRVETQKNFVMLINAFYAFSQDKQNVKLMIYGEGEQTDELQELINTLDCGDKVKLMGRTNDLKGAFENADLFVLSSNFEGMPNVLLEAMAAGLPCVSTDCRTGPKEMIINFENGLLIPTDNMNKTEKAIEYMYNNREEAMKMGDNAREFVKSNYTVDIIVNKFIDIFESKVK